MKIPITRPYFGQEEREAIQLPLETGWLVQGPFVKAFEDKFSAYVGARHSVATTSCTTALHLSVAALGLQPGDEVLVPAFTWVATANVVEYMGATPVFVDIDLATFNIDVAQLEDRLSDRTVGVIPVHLFGLAADMDPLKEFAERHGLWILEDAACGFGARYQGHHVGTFGQIGAFSFHPRKSITTGEGGMVTTTDDRLATTIRSLRDHGASRSDLQRHVEPTSYLLADYDLLGYNFRMTDLQGALGSVQMDRADWILEERHRCAQVYDAMLGDVSDLVLPRTPPDCVHGFQSYVCLFRPEEPKISEVPRLHDLRNRLMAALEADGVATRPGTHAAFTQGFFRAKYNIPVEMLPNAYIADRLSLSLPLFAGMTDLEQNYVGDAIRRGLAALG